MDEMGSIKWTRGVCVTVNERRGAGAALHASRLCEGGPDCIIGFNFGEESETEMSGLGS